MLRYEDPPTSPRLANLAFILADNDVPVGAMEHLTGELLGERAPALSADVRCTVGNASERFECLIVAILRRERLR